jgi:DeoR/GlpR family transcriptional regulator of sugar metabolism
MQTVRDERHADQQEEAERQHLHGRMTVDEIADRFAASSMTII